MDKFNLAFANAGFLRISRGSYHVPVTLEGRDRVMFADVTHPNPNVWRVRVHVRRDSKRSIGTSWDIVAADIAEVDVDDLVRDLLRQMAEMGVKIKGSE